VKSGKNCASCLLTDFQSIKVILPLYIEMSLYHDSGFAFHFYHNYYLAKVREIQINKITRAGDLKSDCKDAFPHSDQIELFPFCHSLSATVNIKLQENTFQLCLNCIY